MQWTSALAIFVLFWVLAAFLVMPFGIRSAHEVEGDLVPGQEHGAPANFDPKPILIRATALAVVMFGLYYVNYVESWLTIDSFGFLSPD
jgi:predicted secreted protein